MTTRKMIKPDNQNVKTLDPDDPETEPCGVCGTETDLAEMDENLVCRNCMKKISQRRGYPGIPDDLPF